MKGIQSRREEDGGMTQVVGSIEPDITGSIECDAGGGKVARNVDGGAAVRLQDERIGAGIDLTGQGQRRGGGGQKSGVGGDRDGDRKSTRLNSSHLGISYA